MYLLTQHNHIYTQKKKDFLHFKLKGDGNGYILATK